MKRYITVLVVALMAVSAWAQTEIDWQKRVARATGIGAAPENVTTAQKRPMAIRAAQADALRQLGEAIKGIAISSDTKVENFVTQSDVIQTSYQGVLKAFKIMGQPQYFEDGTVQVTIELALDGKLSTLCMEGETFATTATATSEPTTTVTAQVYTGLILDCRGISLRPALSPRITDQGDKEIYGSAFVTRDFAISQGMMGYLKDLEKAKGNDRVGKNPLVIKAVSASGANGCDIVLSNEDAAKVASLSANLNFLRECRVIAVIK